MKKFSIQHAAFSIALCALAIILWCAGTFTAQQAQGSLGSVAARWASGGVSPAQLEAQLDIFREDRTQGVPGLTLWAQHAMQSVTDGDEKTIRAPVLELYGPAEYLRSDLYLSGGAPARGSTKTCSLSEGAAFALWGGVNVTGQSLTWKGEDYAVQGVFKSDDSLVIVQAASDSKTLFPNMQLYLTSNAGRQATEEFLARTNFGNPQLLDMPLLGWAMGMLAFLPALLIGLWLLARLVVHALRVRKNARKLFFYLPAAILVAGMDVFLISRGGGVPAALIPSRWSDFDYWAALADNIGGRVKTWLSMPQAGDITMLFALLGTGLLVFGSLLAMSILMGRVRVEKPLHAMLACGGCVLLVFLMAIFYAGRGGLRVNLAMWLMPCLWILSDCALSYWKGGAVLEAKT